jgi:hypothetical protein
MSVEEFVSEFFQRKGSDQITLINSVTDSRKFATDLTSKILLEPSDEFIQMLTASLTLHSNKSLYSEMSEYFGMPLLKQLSHYRLAYEIAKNEHTSVFASLENNSANFLEKSFFVPRLIDALLPKYELHSHFLNLIVVILLQPNMRRFFKPYLEDSLILHQFNFANIPEIDRICHYSINEFTGVYFESLEEHFQSRYAFLQGFHADLLKSGKFLELAKISTIELANCHSHLERMDMEDLSSILNLLHCGNFPLNLSKKDKIQAITSFLKCPSLEVSTQAFNPFAITSVLPLTTESLSYHDLLDRHSRLLQAKVRYLFLWFLFFEFLV